MVQIADAYIEDFHIFTVYYVKLIYFLLYLPKVTKHGSGICGLLPLSLQPTKEEGQDQQLNSNYKVKRSSYGSVPSLVECIHAQSVLVFCSCGMLP